MRLTVPTPDDKPFEQVITNPAVLLEWLDQLPHIDQEGMLSEIAEALSHLIRHPESLSQLPQLLHCYQDTFDELYEQFLANRNAGLDRPEGRKSLSLLNRFLELNRELGFGYNRLINDFSDFFEDGQLIDAVTRAMLTHERDILFAYESYHAITPIARQTLSQLYLFAESRQLADATTDISAISATDILKRVILLHLADPYSLPQQGIWAAHSYLKKHGQMAVFHTEPGRGIMVDLQGNGFPRLNGEMASSTSDSRRFRYIDTRLLCEATRRYVSMSVQDASKLPTAMRSMDRITALQLLRRWHRNWSTPQKRGATREEKYNRIMTACGIESVHHYLQQGTMLEKNGAEQAFDDEVILEGGDIYLASEHLDDYPVYEWQLFDLSDSGAGLIEDESDSACFQIGQLVLLAVHHIGDHNQPWMTGIIRRRLEEGMHKNEIGIQFLNGTLHPLQIHPLISEASDPSSLSPAFLMEREDGVAMLLTMRGLYKPNRAYALNKGGQSKQIHAVSLVESTRYLDIFTFSTQDAESQDI